MTDAYTKNLCSCRGFWYTKDMNFTRAFIGSTYRIGAWLVVIVVLADLLTFLYYPDTVFGKIFIATREQTPLTWLSALAMFFVGAGCVAGYLKSRRALWYALAIIFLFFSMDDATYFHERLAGAVRAEAEGLAAVPMYLWTALYAPLLLFALGALFALAWRTARGRRMGLNISFGLLVLAFGLDTIDGMIENNDQLTLCLGEVCNVIATHMMRLTEEVAEVVALGLLGRHLLLTHAASDGPVS